jgi:hypothetical protein
MLARCQQMTTLAWVALILGWGLIWFDEGRPGWAVFGGLGIALTHAVWLAAGLGLACWQNRRAGLPACLPGDWFRAWRHEVWLAPQVFFWRQPFRSHAEPDHLPTQRTGRRGTLFVHGFVCNRGLWNPWIRMMRLRGMPCMAINLEPVLGDIDGYAELIDNAVQRLTDATGLPPLVVAHSMGGLAVRAWLRREQADHRIHGVVTIAAPHQGTWLARFAFSQNGRQMRPDGDWLQALAASEPLSRRQLFLCIYSRCDNIVFPAGRACLPDARERHVPGAAHVDLVHHPRVMAQVLRALDEPRWGDDACTS